MNTIPSLILFTIFIITKVTNSQFVRGPTTGTWTEALAYCNENENGLAVITSADENAAAIAACTTPSSHTAGCYTGLIVSDTAGAATGNCKWAWYDDTPVSYGFLDGATATVPDTSVWGPSEPNVCATENNMALELSVISGGGWVDIGGSDTVSGAYPFPLCIELTPMPTSNPTATTNNPTATTNNPTATTNNPTATTNNPTVTTNNPTAPTKSPTDNSDSDSDSDSNSDDSDDYVNALTDNNVFDEDENYLKDIHSNDINKNIVVSMSEATVINLWLIFLIIIGIIFAFYCHYQYKSRN